MKRFTLFLATLLGVCGAYAQEATEWPIEPKNEYVEYMLYLESEDTRIMGDVRKTYDLLVEGRALLNEELLIDSDNEELKEAIAQVDELIEFTSKCL